MFHNLLSGGSSKTTSTLPHLCQECYWWSRVFHVQLVQEAGLFGTNKWKVWWWLSFSSFIKVKWENKRIKRGNKSIKKGNKSMKWENKSIKRWKGESGSNISCNSFYHRRKLKNHDWPFIFISRIITLNLVLIIIVIHFFSQVYSRCWKKSKKFHDYVCSLSKNTKWLLDWIWKGLLKNELFVWSKTCILFHLEKVYEVNCGLRSELIMVLNSENVVIVLTNEISDFVIRIVGFSSLIQKCQVTDDFSSEFWVDVFVRSSSRIIHVQDVL